MQDAITSGTIVRLTPEKAVAGGRMLARVDGRIVLVSGAIPGEPVQARVERVEKSMAYAEVVDVLEPHPNRRAVSGDPRCGGASYSHLSYDLQLTLKADVIRDGLKRLARVEPPADLRVAASPESGYRMRSRLHWREGRLGFFLEGSHRVCCAAHSGQLLPATLGVVETLAERLTASGLNGDADIDISENIPADERAVHIELGERASFDQLEELGPIPGVTGLSWAQASRRIDALVYGSPYVVDRVWGETGIGGAPGSSLAHVESSPALRRHVGAFFQANRFLLPNLVSAVIAACPGGPVLDLYAGVGLFGVSLAATGRHRVTAVEGHPASAADLGANAEPYRHTIGVYRMSVEDFVRKHRDEHMGHTLVLDPPRSGMSRQAMDGALALRPSRVVFVSCDVATFARDLGRFIQAGYRLVSLEGFDLFPNTPHVETLAILDR